MRKVGVGRRKRPPHVGSQWGRRFRLPTERSRRLQRSRFFMHFRCILTGPTVRILL